MATPRKARRSAAGFLAPCVLAGSLCASLPLPGETVNKIVLRVNDRVATLYDYELLLTERLVAIRADPGLEAEVRERLIAEAPTAVMNELADELLILSRADQLGITPSELDIDDAITRMRERMGLEEDEAFREALEQSRMRYEDLRQQISVQLMRDEVAGREIVTRVRPTDEDAKRYYEDHPDEFKLPEQLKVREIVVLSEESPVSAATERLAAEIRSRLESGETMEDVASDQTPEVSPVIDLGWVSAGDLAPSLEEALWSLEAGQLSPPIPSRGGLHIVLVEERKAASIQPFSEVREAILAGERRRLYAQEAELYLKELRQRAFWQVDLPEGVEDVLTGAPAELQGVDRLFADPSPPEPSQP